MSKVINLLEKLGQNADANSENISLRGSDWLGSELPLELTDAISSGNHNELIALLGLRTNISCLVFPAKQDEDGDQEKEGDEDEKEPEDDTAKGLRIPIRKVAIG